MNQETKQPSLTRVASYATTPAPQIPRPTCGRCEDWTTIVVKAKEAPCPACRAEDYKTWLDSGNELPRL